MRPPLLEESSVLAALHEHPEWQAAMRRRGIEDRSTGPGSTPGRRDRSAWPTRRAGGSAAACPTCATRPTTTATPVPSKASSPSSTWPGARCSRSSTPGSCPFPPECGSYYPEDNGPLRHGPQAPRDHPARGPELRGRGQPGPLAEVVAAGVHGPGRGPRAPRRRLRGRRPGPAASSTGPRSARWWSPTATPAPCTAGRTPSTPASGAWAAWPTRSPSAATAWA